MQRGIDAGKISVVKNGANRALFQPLPKDEALLRELHLEGKRIIGYIGTHGMAHKLDFILRCAKHLEPAYPQYHFLFIGDGAEKEKLLALKQELQCHNVTMLPSVPKTEVKRYISILDICLINLRRSPLFTTVIPSKIFENAAMEIPILMGVEGEAKDIVEHYGAGYCFTPEERLTLWLIAICWKIRRIMPAAKRGADCLLPILTARCWPTKCLRYCDKR